MTDATPTDESEDAPSVADRVRSHVRDHRTGMLYDLLFALAWVTLVSLLFDYAFVAAPEWAYYLFMLAGIPAYFGFVASMAIAKETQ